MEEVKNIIFDLLPLLINLLIKIHLFKKNSEYNRFIEKKKRGLIKNEII